MVKAKSTWYHQIHKVSTFLRVRDIVELVLDNNVDDIKSMLSMNGSDISEIEKIEREVQERLFSIQSEVEIIFNNYKDESNEKTFSDNKKNPLISLIMYKKQGFEDIKYIDFFKKKYLKSYPLDIVNTNQYK